MKKVEEKVEEKVDGALQSVPNGDAKTAEENPNLISVKSEQKLDRLQQILGLANNPILSDGTKLRGIAEMLDAAYIQPALKKGFIRGQNEAATFIKSKIEELLKGTPTKNRGEVKGLKRALNIFDATN